MRKDTHTHTHTHKHTHTHTHALRLRKRVGGEFFYQLIFGGDIVKVLNVLTLQLKNKNKKVGGHLIFNSFSVLK